MELALQARIDDTLAQAIEAFAKGDAEYSFDLETLKLSIRLIGPAWSGTVDKSIARFLIDIDRALSMEFAGFGIIIPETDHGLVALKIEDGSLAAYLQYSKDTLAAFKKLKPRDQILIISLVLAGLGIWKAPEIITSLNAVQIEEVRLSEKTRLIEEVTRLVDSSRNIQQPMRALVARMGDEDKIALPSADEPLSKAQAKQSFIPSTRRKPSTYYVDERYRVIELSMRNPEKWSITLSYGDVSFKADVLLSHDEVTKLMADFQEAHAKGSEIAPDMQVTAAINHRGIQSASLVGMGEPREKSVKLSEALAAEAVE